MLKKAFCLLTSLKACDSRLPSTCALLVNSRRCKYLPPERQLPYDSRIEVSNEQTQNPLLWDYPDFRRLDQSEADLLYKTVDLETRAHDDAVLQSYEKFLLEACNQLKIKVSSVFKPKIVAGINVDKIIWRRSLLKSAFVHKKWRVQYETRTYFRNLQVKHLTGSTADTFLEYAQRNLPEGVAMKVTRCQCLAIPQHLTPQSS